MSSSNIDVRPPPVPPKSRDNSTEQQQRYGASAYIDQSEYDAYKQSSSQINKNDGGNRGAYSNYSTDNNNRYVEDIDDDDDYPSTQHYTTKNSSTTSYSGLINRSNSYNGLQPRVISAKQRNTSGSSLLYQVKNFKKKIFLNEFFVFKKPSNGTLTREKTGTNRGFRSGSAPTPTPPPPRHTIASNNNNNYYIRRPTVVFNDERGGPSDKSNGAQARVNNKFVNLIIYFYNRN
jgi:hypothetical protein